ncbi:MAG TPA: hypothetical protein PKI32_05360, partial [Opitutales bacterium]|nr:hypothetical protein [Opitutales bacterium]
MQSFGKSVAVSAAILLPLGLRADIHTWCGGNHAGGGWNVADNWKNAAGGNEVPAPGDTAVITYA